MTTQERQGFFGYKFEQEFANLTLSERKIIIIIKNEGVGNRWSCPTYKNKSYIY